MSVESIPKLTNRLLDVNSLPSATVAGTDEIAIADVDASNSLKKVTAQSIADLASGGASISGTDNRIVRVDGTDALQDSSVTLDDSDNVSGVNNLVHGGQTYQTDFPTQLPSGTTFTVDWNDGNAQEVDLGSASGNLTATLSNPNAGGFYFLKIIQASTARTITWPAAVKWAEGVTPVLSTVDDSIDSVTLFYDGTNYLGIHTPGYA